MRISARRLIALVPVLLGLFVLTYVLAATTPGAPVSTLLGLEMRQGDPSSLITLSHQRDFDVCMSPWNGRQDPDGNMLLYFSKAGPTDLPGYDDAKVTDWLAEVQTVTDPAARVRLHHQAQPKPTEDAPMLFLHFDAIIQAGSARLNRTQYPGTVLRLHDARMS